MTLAYPRLPRPSARRRKRVARAKRGGGREPLPAVIEPMLATLAPAPPVGDDWNFEYKWDGIRALARWDGKQLNLITRNLLDTTKRYPELHALGPAIGSKHKVMLDGEIVALDDVDRPSFPLLQQRMHLNNARSIAQAVHTVPVMYIIFDLLYLDGEMLTSVPLIERRRMLEELTIAGPTWRISPAYRNAGKEMFATAQKHGLEGIVAKRLDSLYEPGRRSPDWRKIKIAHRQEFVVGGWTPQVGTKDTLGTLQIGYYELPPGQTKCRPSDKLIHAGGVGTGFDEEWRRRLMPMLNQLSTDKNPFAAPISTKPSKWQAIRGRTLERDVHFVKPKLVVEIEFRRWPIGGNVQQASFKGLRTDKRAETVTKEFRLSSATD